MIELTINYDKLEEVVYGVLSKYKDTDKNPADMLEIIMARVEREAEKKSRKWEECNYMTKDWNFYDKYDEAISKFVPISGEGGSLASQAATAVNKLIYKWYNDGDVYDNTHHMTGWFNDLSSYANWLHKFIPITGDILDRISDCRTNSYYEDLLADLSDMVFEDAFLKELSEIPAKGSIYNCSGPYRFAEEYHGYEDDRDDYDDDDEDYDDDDEEE